MQKGINIGQNGGEEYKIFKFEANLSFGHCISINGQKKWLHKRNNTKTVLCKAYVSCLGSESCKKGKILGQNTGPKYKTFNFVVNVAFGIL